MNRAYRLVWNNTLNGWAVASELARGHKKTASFKVGVIALLLGMSSPLYAAPALNALPEGETVISGRAGMNRLIANRLVVNQYTDKLIAHWDSFDIGANAQVIFKQPDAGSIVLNRVSSGSASQIFGRLDANGQVFIINPAGITFGASAQVNSAALLASSMNIKDSDFLNGTLLFERNNAQGRISNAGSLNAASGNVVLLAPSILNSGNIRAVQANIFLVNAERARIVDSNATVLQAPAIASLIRQTGALTANSLESGQGKILLLANQHSAAGKLELRGSMDAQHAWVKGYDIQLTGNTSLSGNVSLEASHHLINQRVLSFNRDASTQPRLLNLSYAVDGLLFSTGARIDIPDGSTQLLRINGNYYSVINNLTQLDAMNSNASTLAGRYVLGSTVNASASVNWNAGSGFNPIGTTQSPFRGVLDGFGHSILNLNIKRPAQDRVGLFAALNGAQISRLALVNMAIQGNNDVGGLAGFMRNSTVSNVSVQGVISGNARVGGLAGYGLSSNYRYIDTAGRVNGVTSRLGGMLGYNSGGQIQYANSRSEVVGGGSASIGGLVGYNDAADISFSTSSATVSRTGILVGIADSGMGGLVGYHASGIILDSQSSASVTGLGPVGGLVGYNNGIIDGGQSSASLRYAGTSNFVSRRGMGGLVGVNDGTVTRSQASAQFNGAPFVGGLVGASWGSIDNSSVAWADQTITPGGVGGLVADNYGLVQNSQVSGNLLGNSYIGGLVNYNSGTIRDSSVNASITSLRVGAGGLVGLNSGSIVNATAYGSVQGVSDVGGAIGRSFAYGNTDHTVNNVQVFNSVSGTDSNIGGFIGLNNGVVFINNSSASGAVSGRTNVGGFVGQNRIDTIDGTPLQSNITGAVASGNVSGQNNVGGFAGINAGQIENAHASGDVTGSGGVGAAAFVWQNSGSIRNSDASGRATYGFTAVNTVNASITGSSANGSAVQAGFVGENSGQISQAYSSGTGTVRYGFAEQNYSTGQISDSVAASNAVYAGFVGSNYGQINGSAASGNVNGAGNSFIGGFAAVNLSGASINDSHASGDVSGVNTVGGLVGYNKGNISRSYATGNVSGQQYVGGLVGVNDYFKQLGSTFYVGIVRDSYATGAVTGVNVAGGLIGNSDGEIYNSYATGPVSGANAGGLAGFAGIGGVIRSSYWNLDSSGQSSSSGGKGLTAAQTRQKRSYAGWDISSDPLGSSVWYINEGTSSPVLR